MIAARLHFASSVECVADRRTAASSAPATIEIGIGAAIIVVVVGAERLRILGGERERGANF